MRRQSSGALSALEFLQGVMDWGLRLAGLVLIVVTGYYIYATVAHGAQLFQGMGANNQPMSPQDFQRHIANLEFLTKILLLASVVTVICAIGRYYPYPETGLALLFVGLLLFFAMPFLIDNVGSTGGDLPRALRRFGDPRAYLKSRYGLAGSAFMGAGLVLLMFHAVMLVSRARERRPQPNAESARTAAQVRKANDQFLGPCWKLPFCRDTDKKLCPVRHSKQPCWRKGRGCYCDQNIILTLSGGSQYAASRGAAGYLSRTATVARAKSFREKREQCLACPVYLHHQHQKYRLLAPLTLIGVIGAAALYWEPVSQAYPEAMLALGRALSGFSFGSSTGGVPAWANDLARNAGIMWLIIAVVVLLLLAYLLQGVEWVLYRLGI
jgi:hypothetical protein